MAYAYAIHGTLDNLAFADMQIILTDPVFGEAPQSIASSVPPAELAAGATTDTSSTPQLAATMNSPYRLSGAGMNRWRGQVTGPDADVPWAGSGREPPPFHNQVQQLVQSLAGFGVTHGHGWVSPVETEVDPAHIMQLTVNWQQAA